MSAQETPAPAATVQWDSTAASEVRSAVERGFSDFAAMELAGIQRWLSTDGFLPSYDTDIANKPVRMGSRDEAVKYAENMIAEVKKMNAKATVTAKTIDCQATATFAVCVSDYDFTATMPDGKSMSQPSRGTIALAKGPDGWKWTHWHSSPAPAPVK
jgi:ketosteroid isomerase-like protein